MSIDWHNKGFWYKLSSAFRLVLLVRVHRLTSVRLIFSRPWFERMWVIQEVSCSKLATVISGSARISFDHLMVGVKFGIDKRILRASLGNQMINVRAIQNQPGNQSAAVEIYTIKTRDTDAHEILLDYLQLFATSKCKDPRDKIFALYGISELPYEHTLVQSFKHKNLQPDHRMDIAELYVEVSKSCMTDGSLDVLSKPCLQLLSRIRTLPSWAIDWTAFDKADVFASLAATGQFKSTLGSKIEPCFSCDGGCMLSGILLDTVEVVGKPFEVDSHHSHHP